MRFLVTGAGGLIGANVALHLDAQGHEVHVLDLFQEGRKENLAAFKGVQHQGDIRTFDYGSLGRFDGIFHQAACADTTVMDEKFMLSTNVDAHLKILDFARRTGCPKVVYASSAATYGKTPPPNKETNPPAPANIYGVSKARMEAVTKEFCAEHPEVKAVGLRYFNVYGPLEFHKKKAVSMTFQLYKQISEGKAPRVFKWGEQYRDFIYVKDVVAANWKAFEYGGSGVFNVGTGVKTSFNDIIAVLNKTLGAAKPTEYIDNPYAFYQDATLADMAWSEKELGFKAAHTPAEGIADYVKYLMTSGETPRAHVDRVKALIIEDTPDLRDLLQIILEGFGIETETAADGKIALETIKAKGPFDFCTVDIFMPVMDGFSFVKALRADKAYDKVKLLMVTTDVEKVSVVKALDLGADEYLMKPYTKDMVEGKLKLMGFLE